MMAVKSDVSEGLAFAVWAGVFHSFFPLNQAIHMKVVFAVSDCINPAI